MRTKNTFINLLVNLGGQGVGLFVGMVARVFFVRLLSAEYLGLSNLFTNIISMFSLVELGVGSAMTFSLYQPLAEQDVEKIKSLMMLYRKLYRLIGSVMLILGFCGIPFYRYFMKEVPPIDHLDLIYLLFVWNTAISYFYSYKRSLIITDQKRYIATLFRYSFYIVLNVVQIIVLYFTRNYYLFVGLQILFTWLENFFVSKRADKMYPYLKEKCIRPLTKDEFALIKRDIGAMIFHKIGGLTVNSTDNIIISKFLGLMVSGLYANYALIIQALKTVTAQFFQSLTASVGNLKVSEDEQYVLDVFYKILFISFWIFSFVAISLGILINPFVEIWLGPSYCFNGFVAAVLAANFFFYAVRQAVLTFRDATGTYYYDRYKPLFEAIINLVASVWLVIHWGVAGVFIGTLLGFIFTGFWVEPLILYKHIFHRSLKEYFKKYFVFLGVTSISAVCTVFVGSLVPGNDVFSFFAKVIICVTIPNGVFWIFFHRSTEFRYFIMLAKKLFSLIWRKLLKKINYCRTK